MRYGMCAYMQFLSLLLIVWLQIAIYSVNHKKAICTRQYDIITYNKSDVNRIYTDVNITDGNFNLSGTDHYIFQYGEALPTYQLKSHPNFTRLLNESMHAKSIQLLNDCHIWLSKYNISYIMGQGTLLGSYFFHDSIPWDDDLDIFVDILHVNKLRAVFRLAEFQEMFHFTSFHEPRDIDIYSAENLKEDIPLPNTHYCGKNFVDKGKTTAKCYQMVKLYYKNSPNAGRYRWGYPFIDVFFTYRQGDYIYNHESLRIKNLKISVNKFYPLTLRPLNKLWLPSPRDTKAFLKMDYKQFKCQMSDWDHEHEVTFRKRTLSFVCDKLKLYYPYAKRRPVLDNKGAVVAGIVIEDLLIKNKVLHSVETRQLYKSADILSLN